VVAGLLIAGEADSIAVFVGIDGRPLLAAPRYLESTGWARMPGCLRYPAQLELLDFAVPLEAVLRVLAPSSAIARAFFSTFSQSAWHGSGRQKLLLSAWT
jgi:hypothetical protein